MRPATAAERDLHVQADAARANAYAPYSSFTVGAVAIAADGSTHVGVNVENASYGLTICAERAAAVRAVSEGHRRLTLIAVAGPSASVTPCGACRQVLRELGGPGLTVVLGYEGSIVTVTLEELLPLGFGPEDLA